MSNFDENDEDISEDEIQQVMSEIMKTLGLDPKGKKPEIIYLKGEIDKDGKIHLNTNPVNKNKEKIVEASNLESIKEKIRTEIQKETKTKEVKQSTIKKKAKSKKSKNIESGIKESIDKSCKAFMDTELEIANIFSIDSEKRIEELKNNKDLLKQIDGLNNSLLRLSRTLTSLIIEGY